MIKNFLLWFCTVLGRVFYSFGADYENNLSNTDDHDLGTANVPLTDDLRV